MVMGFETVYYYGGIFVYYTMGETIGDEDFNKIFSDLDSLLEKKKPFVFLIDTTKVKCLNNKINNGFKIVNWMKKNKSQIASYLKASSIILSNKAIIKILNWVFERQKPVSPNYLGKSLSDGIKFVEKVIPERIKNNLKIDSTLEPQSQTPAQTQSQT